MDLKLCGDSPWSDRCSLTAQWFEYMTEIIGARNFYWWCLLKNCTRLGWIVSKLNVTYQSRVLLGLEPVALNTGLTVVILHAHLESWLLQKAQFLSFRDIPNLCKDNALRNSCTTFRDRLKVLESQNRSFFITLAQWPSGLRVRHLDLGTLDWLLPSGFESRTSRVFIFCWLY